MALTDWTKQGMAALPAEAEVVRKVVRTLKNAGQPIVKIHDGEESYSVNGEHDILNVVFNLDWARLYTADGSWVLIIMGNEYDALSDYSIDLEDALKPFDEWYDTKS